MTAPRDPSSASQHPVEHIIGPELVGALARAHDDLGSDLLGLFGSLMPVGIYLMDPDLSMRFHNRRYAELTGEPDADLRGHRWIDALDDRDRADVVEGVELALRTGIDSEGLSHRLINGVPVTLRARRTPVRDSTGAVIGLIGVVDDVSAVAENQEQLEHRARTDSLTGLPNRQYIVEHLERALARARRDDASIGLLFCDIDQFKVVNDTLGHGVGDQLITAVAARLSRLVRSSELLGRLGGDEFVVICEGQGSYGGAEGLAERVVSAMDEPFVLPGPRTVHSTLSIGVANAVGGVASPEELLAQADLALYRAKDRGRARWERFDESLRAQMTTRHRVGTELRGAVGRDEIRVFYQPVVDLATAEVVGAEALMRWQHPTLGLLTPAAFIDVAEETGEIHDLGRFVLRQACAEAAGWTSTGASARWVAVNVSARQLARADFVTSAREATNDAGLDPSRLKLEITEHALLDPVRGHQRDHLGTMHLRGTHIVLDDFGTGNSALAHLRLGLVHGVKIDRSFIEAIDTDEDVLRLVQAIVGLARFLGLEVVAEGIERRDQAAAALAVGCQFAQGHLFGVPVPPEHLQHEFESTARRTARLGLVP